MRQSEDASASISYAETAYGSGNRVPSQIQRQAAYAGAAQSNLYQTHSRPVGSFGPLFRELRRALGLTLTTTSSFTGASVDVLVALESGDLSALPPWPETERVVIQLTSIAQIDPRPVLNVIHRELSQFQLLRSEPQRAPHYAFAPTYPSAHHDPFYDDFDEPIQLHAIEDPNEAMPLVTRGGPRTGPAPSQRSAPTGRAGDEDADVSRSKAALLNVLRAILTVPSRGRMVALTAVLIAAGGTIAQGSAIKASFATLQTPISRLLRGAENYLIWRSAPIKDGLKWITVDDPRSRKGDKLRHSKPSA